MAPRRTLGAVIPLAAALAAAPSPAAAYTQWSAAVSLGGGGRLLPEERREGLVMLGLRADVLFGARLPLAARVGPYLSAWTLDFAELHASAGASLLVPVSSTTPLVFSAGATLDLTAAAEGSRPPLGVTARAWWGSRSLNVHSHYGMAVGVWLETRWAPGDGTTDVVAGIDGDLAFISLPALLLWNWLTR